MTYDMINYVDWLIDRYRYRYIIHIILYIVHGILGILFKFMLLIDLMMHNDTTQIHAMTLTHYASYDTMTRPLQLIS